MMEWDRLTLEVPWKPLAVNDGRHFLYKFAVKELNYRILVTDLKSMWGETMEMTRITALNNKLNPNIETSIQRLLREIEGLLTKDIVWKGNRMSGDVTKLRLSASSTLASVEFHWSFHLNVVDQTEFYDQMTGPLLLMASELMRRQQALVGIIADKDAQIQDYRAQGTTLATKSKSELAFDYAKFADEMTKLQANDTSQSKLVTSAFDSPLQEFYVQVVRARKRPINEQTVDGPNDAQVRSDTNKASPVTRDVAPRVTEISEKEMERLRRQALLDKLEEEKNKMDSSKKNSKKLKL